MGLAATHPVRRPAGAGPVALSVALSVCVHAGIAGGVVSFFAARGALARLAPWLWSDPQERAPADPALPRPELAEPVASLDPVVWIRPGIDDSSSDAPVWIGFKDETEHTAFTASVDQSAVTDDQPGMRGDADAIPAPAAPPGEPLPAGAPAPAVTVASSESQSEPARPEVAAPPPDVPQPEETPRPPLPAPAPQPATAPADAPAELSQETRPPPPPEIVIGPRVTPVPEDERKGPADEDERATEPVVPPELLEPIPAGPPSPAGESAPTPPSRPSEEPAPTPPPLKPAAPPSPAPTTPRAPAPEASPAPTPATNGTATPGAPPAPVPSGQPGEQADKEADATSIKEAVDYRAGRVKAGEGIDIKTVKPEFSNYTLITALPRVPIVEITFTTKGKVKNVRLLQSSGYKDVDEPIMNAVWAWSAKGRKLEILAKQNPNATLKLSVRMLL